MKTNFDTYSASDESFWRFVEEVEEEGSPMTFGPSIPLYDRMLAATHMNERLKEGVPKTLLVGGTIYSISEYRRYIQDINPNALASVLDLRTDRTRMEDGDTLLIHHIQANAKRIPLASNSQDALFTNWLLHHLESGVPEMIQECYRVLKPGGGLFMVEVPSEGDDFVAPLRELHFSRVESFEGHGWTRGEYLTHLRGKPIEVGGKYGWTRMGGTAIYGIK